jgi:hypothetical protein
MDAFAGRSSSFFLSDTLEAEFNVNESGRGGGGEPDSHNVIK